MRKRKHGTYATLVAESLTLVLALVPVREAAADGASRWGASYFPNIELTTQDGVKVRFFDDVIKDKIVAINFIFTSCGKTCPAETAKLRQVQKQLGDRVGKDIFFYSISIDPEHDTPAVLKEYAKKFNVQPGWEFLTGDKEQIQMLRKKLGMLRDETEPDLQNHAVSMIVGNQATGQWMKRSTFDDAPVLARLLGGMLSNWSKDSPGADKRVAYGNVGKIAPFSKGEYVFQTRCVNCHSHGKGDGIGPGLAHVTEYREHAWLARWLKEPDRVLAESKIRRPLLCSRGSRAFRCRTSN